jgi:hypothetical protein
MAVAKYKKYVEEMFAEHKELMMEFVLLNQAYAQDKRGMKSRFDEEGEKVKVVVQEWEDRLCGQMEKGENGVYSAKLAEKFQGELLKYFPFFHEVGMTIRFQD